MRPRRRVPTPPGSRSSTAAGTGLAPICRPASRGATATRPAGSPCYRTSPPRSTEGTAYGRWHEGRPVGAQDPAGHVELHHVPGRAGRPAHAGLPGRVHHLEVPAAGHRRPARLAGRPGGLGAARRGRREEARSRRHGGGVGTVRRQSHRRLVRPAQWLPRPVRDVPAAPARGTRPGRGHPRSPQQPDAGGLRTGSRRRGPAGRGRAPGGRRCPARRPGSGPARGPPSAR